MKRDTKILLLIVAIAFLLVTAMPKVEDIYRRSVAKKVFDLWHETAEKYGGFNNTEPAIILAMIAQESSGNPDSVNPADPSRGLMQITPGALSDFNRQLGRSYTFDDMFVPYKNVEVGTWYYASRYAKTGNVRDAIAAYNAGLGNIPAGYLHADKVEKYLLIVRELYGGL